MIKNRLSSGKTESPTLTQLRVFVAVARHESLTRAAEDLSYINLSSAVYHIKSLERIYGVELFVHRKKRMQLTEFGRTLYIAADEIISKLDEVERLIAAQRRVREKLAFGGPVTALALMRSLYGVINEPLRDDSLLEERRPLDAKITVYWESREVETALLNGEIDVGILCQTSPQYEGRFELIPFEEEELVVASMGLGLGNGSFITKEELASLSLLAPKENSETRMVLDDVAGQIETKFGATIELPNLPQIIKGVVAGRGVAILPASTVRDQFNDGSARLLRLRDIELRRKLLVARIRGKEEDYPFQKFLEALGQVLMEGRRLQAPADHRRESIKASSTQISQ